MKKLIPLILTAALTLAACASAPDTASTPLANSTPEPTAATTPAPATDPFYGVGSSYNNGDTYYAFAYRGEDSLLLKTDYATATQTVNCTVPGCAHDSDACPAYFTDDPGRNLIITDDRCASATSRTRTARCKSTPSTPPRARPCRKSMGWETAILPAAMARRCTA